MYILIEQYQYPAEKVNDVLSGISTLQDVDKNVSVNYVGYYYNPKIMDCVFILPKVLMDENEKVFGKYLPEDIIHLEKQQKLEKEEHDFIYGLAVWIYRAIVVFRDSERKGSNIVLQQQMQQMSKGRLKKSNTFLDILLAIQKFNRENQDFFFFVLKNIHSGYNKINWTKTIAKSEAFIQQGTPIYLNPVNKKKQINFDEELLIIFFSILHHIHEKYGFPVMINVNFPLITGQKFEGYINGFGKTRLRQIKYKYYSDKALYLWELCYAFFDQSKKINIECDEREYLLVKDFNIVFEAIIDELVGTKASQLPKGLIDQEDGKIVDHLWVDKIVLPTQEQKDVYYIGDSKYYKDGRSLGNKSIYKQYTYARNVIQWSFDNLDKPEVDSQYRIRLRDDKTEGYNVIPNFFISAKVDFGTLSYSTDDLRLHGEDPVRRSSQFENRLFDRDTLLLSHYDVNFLFVLSLYARNNTSSKLAWRDKVRAEFRRQIQGVLEEEYTFYAMQPLSAEAEKEYMSRHFQDTLGKIYSLENSGCYSLALKKDDPQGNNAMLVELLKRYFRVTECSLEEDPQEVLSKAAPTTFSAIEEDGGVLCVMMENYEVKSRKFSCGMMGVPLNISRDINILMGIGSVRYVLFHTRGNKGENQHLFKLLEPPMVVKGGETGDLYLSQKEKDYYVRVHFDINVEHPQSKTLNCGKENLPYESKERYDAQFATLSQLLVKDSTSFDGVS